MTITTSTPPGDPMPLNARSRILITPHVSEESF